MFILWLFISKLYESGGNMDNMPLILEDYLNYTETIRGKSASTTKEYYYDLRIFFRFLKVRYRLIDKDTQFEERSSGQRLYGRNL